MYRLTDVTKNGKTRTDGFYPDYIGSLVDVIYKVVDRPLVIERIEDTDGNKKYGKIWTSLVTKIEEDASSDVITVTTLNSIYTLTKA